MKTKLALTTTLVTCQILVTGCTGIASMSGDETLSVNSVPSGASVFIMDKKIGETPLQIDQTTIYPNTYDPDKQSQYGVVSIRKAGCTDYSRRIGYRELIKNIDAELECGDSQTPSRTEAVQAAQSPTTNEVRSEPVSPQVTNEGSTKLMREKSVKNRLIELNQLKDEGLITPEEFQTIRRKILNAI
ncbi:MAG: SHOCT domain-containing protein [Candidatus Thiodiazotropha sp. (ex Monitilora ramsayi)]|nr:SHOCT domain-containing protein [Candidatus Thiodiazotropha sp. (ex Monitilora ramsayi)]